MALDDFRTDEQQAEVVRQWLRENLAFVVGGIVVALGGLFGWQQWQDYRDTQAERASGLYEELIAAVGGGRLTQAEEVFADLQSRYAGSAYIDQSRFVLAKASMDRNDFETAAEHLAAAVDNTTSPEFRHIARLRLARVRLQQQQYEVALDVLGPSNPDSAFAARYDDIRGDVYFAQGRLDDAREAYEAALMAGQIPPVVDRVLVQAKLDALGGARASDDGDAEADAEQAGS
ncbi:MAG: YfgM family protein [Gammaproteobacteria bacterium]